MPRTLIGKKQTSAEFDDTQSTTTIKKVSNPATAGGILSARKFGGSGPHSKVY